MQPDIDKMRNEFFKKSISVGHHNAKYSWKAIMLMIMRCIRGLESFEEGARSPSPQTLRDRLRLDGEWLAHFHSSMLTLAECLVRIYARWKWYISIDETHTPFFGKRKKLNKELVSQGLGKLVYGYRAKTPGATGSFCFLVVSLCCWKIRIPVAIKMMAVGEPYEPWLKPMLKKLLKLVPKAVILADRGFGKATWFYLMMDSLDASYVVRIPLRKKKNKKKVKQGLSSFQYWMTDQKTKEKALLTVFVARDKKKKKYFLASNLRGKNGKWLLATYMNRWDLENIFKDSDRVLLPTSSRQPLMRLFCMVASFLLFALWQVSRMLNKERWSLRSFVKCIIATLCTILQKCISPIGEITTSPP